MSNDIISADEAISLLPDFEYVHNTTGGAIMIGIDYTRPNAEQALRDAIQIELGGPSCRAYRHPIVANEMTDVPEDVKALAEVYAKLCFRFGDDVSEEDVREAIEDAVMADRAALTPKEQK